jgi:hypothetical protein
MDEGEGFVLDVLFVSEPVPGNLYLGVYKVPVTEPAETLVLTGLTEPSGMGYQRKALVRGSWVRTGDLITYPNQTFLATADWGDIYGYFLATSLDNSGKLLAMGHFSAPLNVLDGKGIIIIPKIRVS